MAYVGFDKLAAKTNPAIAASIGRKKYGNKAFNKAAKEGKTMENEKPLQEGGAVNVVLAKKRRKLEGIKKKNQLKKREETKEKAFKTAAKATTKALFPKIYKGVFKGSPSGEYVTEAIMRKQNKRKGGIISKLQDGGTISRRGDVNKKMIEHKLKNLKPVIPTIYTKTTPGTRRYGVGTVLSRPADKTTEELNKLHLGSKGFHTQRYIDNYKNKNFSPQNEPHYNSPRYKEFEAAKKEKVIYRKGGVAQGKSPGVDTATTIDGTTYYQEGGTVKERLEVKSWKPTKPISPKPYEPESKLDTIQAALKKANVEREAIGTEDDKKARKLKREQDKLKQEAKFKKGGKMKYKKGGIVSKLQNGGKGQWDTNTGDAMEDYTNTYFQSPETQADFDAFKKERGGYNFGKKHDRLRSRAQNIESKNLQLKPTGERNWKKEDRRKARAARLRDKARGIRSESYGLQKGGIIGKIKSKLKKKKGRGKSNYEDVGGRAVDTKTKEASPYYSEIKEDLKKGNRY